MPEPTAPSVTAWLQQLDELRAAATPGPWAQQNDAPNLVYGDEVNGIFVCNTGYDRATSPADSLPVADAALIVAAVNALPQLTAAVRAVLELATELAAKCPPDDWGSGGIEDAVAADIGRAFLAKLGSVTA